MSEFIRDDYIADRVLFAANEIKRLRAENARLEELIADRFEIKLKMAEEIAKLRAENANERLRAERATAEFRRVCDENAKLRTALERQLLDRYTYDEVLDIARAALEETK